MKGKQNRSAKNYIPTDQAYIQNLNLVTGDKFNYDRPLLTDRQIKQLCFDQTKQSIDKFIALLNDGQKMQKWSIFENITHYINGEKDALLVLQQINKNYNQLTQYIAIIGQGICSYLQTNPKYLNKQIIQLIFELTYRTMAQNPSQVQDWNRVLQKIAKYPYINIEKCSQFINGSFSLNSVPQRRRAAFNMIHHLMEYSNQIRKLATTKALFFNKDQNPKTRVQICLVLKNIVQQGDSKNEEAWKAIWEYYHDKDLTVQQVATNLLFNTYRPSNFQLLIQSFSEQSCRFEIVSKYIGDFIVNFRTLICQQQRPKIQILSLFNRIIKQKKIQNIANFLKSLNRPGAVEILGQGYIYEDINFSNLPIKNSQVLQPFLIFYHSLQDIQFKQALHSLIMKNLKQIQYEYYGSYKNLVSIFNLSQQQQITVYLNLCSKMLQASKWYQLNCLIEVFSTAAFTQSQYQKACAFVLALWKVCPHFMIQKVTQNVIYLVLINKRSFQFLITIRQKILNSKFWTLRKNYIIFYAILKSQTSFECHKFIPTLIYKNIIADKSVGVKLTLLQNIITIFKYTDPSVPTQKSMIRQTISRLQEDKDPYIRQKAVIANAEISRIEKNNNWLVQIYDRNRQLVEKQARIMQVTIQPKKIIRTQNQISKISAKSKRKLVVEQRRTINIGKSQLQMHKDISIDSITMGMKPQNNQKQGTSLANNKKVNLFRCHSVKIKGPVKKI